MSSLFGTLDPTQGTYSASQISAAPASTDQKIVDAEQAARQAWMDMGMEGRKQGVDPSVYQTLYSTNDKGQTVRNSDGFVAPWSINQVSNPNAQEYYKQNPQELFALGALGGAGGQGYFKDAGVRGTTMKYGQLTPDQWYRGYTSSFEKGWDQDTSNTYRWADQPALKTGGPAQGVAGIQPVTGGQTPSPSTGDRPTAIRDYVGQVLSGNYTDQQRAQMIGSQAAKYGYSPEEIAAATGYDLATVNKYLALAGPTTTGGTGSYGGSSVGTPKTGFNLSDIAGPSAWTVNGNQTVANQLQSLLSSDNPLIQQARTRALQDMNGRGTINSTMAQSGADAAAYDAMLKVAQQDASTNASAAQSNTAAQNQFTADANAFVRNGYMADFNLSANDWAAWQDFQRQRELMALELQYNNASTDKNVAQTNSQAYINGINQARTDWAKMYASLASDPNISPENRDASLAGLATTYNTTIKQYAGLLGWSSADSWLIKYDVPPATKADAAPATQGSQSGTD